MIEVLRMRLHLFPSIAVVASLALAACGAKDDDTEAPDAAPAVVDDTPLALEVVGASVTRGDLVLTVNASGQISSEAIASVQAGTAGTVQEVLVTPGQTVKAGQVLARLETRLLDLTVRQARSTLATAELNFASALQDDSLAMRRTTPERREMLRASTGVAGSEVALERALYDLEHAEVRAPYAGVVERIGVVPGDRIGAGQFVALIVDMEHLRIDAQVMEHDIAALRTGGTAEIVVGAVGSTPIRGRIAAILPLVDSVLKFGRASIRFTGNGVIRPGMFATVRLEAARIPDQIIVPIAAMGERNGRPMVFVVHDSTAHWQYVRPGPQNHREVSILPDTATGMIPLQPGDTILVAGHRTLIHQAPIRLVRTRGDNEY